MLTMPLRLPEDGPQRQLDALTDLVLEVSAQRKVGNKEYVTWWSS